MGGVSMWPTMVRAINVMISPDANATFTTPCGRSSTMKTRLRIVRPGSETTIVAWPGRNAEAGMMRGVDMRHPQLGVKVPWPSGAMVPAR